MRRPWFRFFFLLLPAMLVASALVCEGAAYALRGIQPYSTSLDAIVVAAERQKPDAKWLVFGDSTAQHVLMDYTLGPPSEVANLTTHAGAGMPSMEMLLKRYLATHTPPKAIMLAVTPEMYLNLPSTKNAKFWLFPVFRKPEEQAWLAQFYPDAKAHGWRPAATDLKYAIIDPLTGLVAPNRDTLPMGPATPSPDIPTEPPEPPSPTTLASLQARLDLVLELQSMPRAILTDICHLAREKGFTVHLIDVPLPAALRQAWTARGDLPRLDAQVDALMTQQCGALYSHADLSATVVPPNFDEGATHIEGIGWEDRFALALKRYIDSGGRAQQAGSASVHPS